MPVSKPKKSFAEIWLGLYQAALAGQSVNESISSAAEWAAKTADLALKQYLQRFEK